MKYLATSYYPAPLFIGVLVFSVLQGYEFIKELGTGGFGVVYLVREKTTGRWGWSVCTPKDMPTSPCCVSK